MHDLLHCYPGRNTVRPGHCTMRQIVACATCAYKDWICDYYPCYLWKEPPVEIANRKDDGAAISDDEEEVDEDQPSRKGPALRDADGYCYFGPADAVHALLDVEKYVDVVPLAPLEELHASSVQHPRYPHMRWLLNTRRVPVLPHSATSATEARGATEHLALSPAGIGDTEKAAWLCHECAGHLCCKRPKMPPQALANWNWGGREHPMYQHLSTATEDLLGLGKLISRMVLLKPSDGTEESELAMVGNQIMVAMPRPEVIAEALPPTEAQQASYFNVLYGAGGAENAENKFSAKKALVVNRDEYLECARLRQSRCPLFSKVPISSQRASEQLHAEGPPPGTVHGAIEINTLENFAPNLSGPATRHSPFCKGQDDESGSEDAEDAEDDCAKDATDCARAPDALIADENQNAEYLIGLDGSPDDDPIGKFASFTAKLKIAQDLVKKTAAAAVRHHQAKDSDDGGIDALHASSDLTAILADHKEVCIDLRTMAKSMGKNFQSEIECCITADHGVDRETAMRKTPATLRIHTGEPLSFFDPAAWVACCVQFFYGDCAPNLGRPAKISWRRLMRYLMNKEELEYHLDSDSSEYKANADSRWNTPKFAALFVDVLRKLEVLQSTKAFWLKHSQSFGEDIKHLAKATDKDIADFQANMQQAALKNTSITDLISCARHQGATAVQKTLQHMLMHTANAPMTEGYKMAIRHTGQAMNTSFGPFSSFFTCNFADTYHVLTKVLSQGAFEPLGSRPLNILQDSPPMPTSQEMHKIVAKQPMVQANLFLLLDALTHQHILCARTVFLGKQKYDPTSRWQNEPYCEDDFSSSGDLGIAGLIHAVLKALEAQGRGFAHGHEKTHSEPMTKAIDLVMLFDGRKDDQLESSLKAWMAKHREACLKDAVSKQYDSAVESARQFGCDDLKEVFTEEERRRCKLDGGFEEDGTKRGTVEVVPAPEPAHVLREKDTAIAEGRALRHPYRGMPLTGAPGARFPLYLRAEQFYRYPDLDSNGHADDTLDAGAPEHCACSTGWIDKAALYVTSATGLVTGFRKPDGSVASQPELQSEARRYSWNFATDSRFCHIFNHTHECKPTCFKNTEYVGPTNDKPASRGACRFRFWRLVRVALQWFRRMGKALVPEPKVATEDDANNEYGRCGVCRQNCFRGSSNDVCQVCLRCNVDYQYQTRTFPEVTTNTEPSSSGASEHTSERRQDQELQYIPYSDQRTLPNM